jgi:glucose/arabinose dehydrogenase
LDRLERRIRQSPQSTPSKLWPKDWPAAFSFNFLPDGRILVAERAGHLKLVGKDGKITELEGLPSNLWTRGQGLYEARPDRSFSTNRTILPDIHRPSGWHGSECVAANARCSRRVASKIIR